MKVAIVSESRADERRVAATPDTVGRLIKKQGFEITNGSVPIASIPKVDGHYDLERLGELMLALKRQHPEKHDASVLLEPHIEYDHLIQVMDTVRSVELEEGEETLRADLFTAISIGDAP